MRQKRSKKKMTGSKRWEGVLVLHTGESLPSIIESNFYAIDLWAGVSKIALLNSSFTHMKNSQTLRFISQNAILEVVN